MQKPIIIFGGSFDPIHLGHVAIIRKIINLAHPNKFIIVPCKQSVFKNKTLFSAQQRIKFIHLACKDYSNFIISDYEINSPNPSYTVETLRYFRSMYGTNNPLIFVVGEDAFQDFDKWQQAEEILKLTNLLVIDREKIHSSQTWHDFNKLSGEIKYLNIGQYPQSSSEIKKLIASKNWDKLTEMLAPEVLTAVQQQLKT